MEKGPGLVLKSRERCFICTEVCAVEDNGCSPFILLDLLSSDGNSYKKTIFTLNFVV